jgi:hypothetical protein
MRKSLAIAAFGLLLIAAFLGLSRLSRGEPSGPGQPGSSAAAGPRDIAPHAASLGAESTLPAREEQSSTPVVDRPPQTPVHADSIESFPLGGLVLDLVGRPVAGVSVGFYEYDDRLAAGVTPAKSDADGRFAFTRPRRGGSLRVVDEGWTTVLVPTLFDEAEHHEDLTLVVVRAGRLAGLVVDPEDRPVARAKVHVVLATDFRPKLARILDRCCDATFETECDAEGRFAIERAPVSDEARLFVVARGYALATVPIGADRERQRITLQRAHEGDALVGRVLDAATHAPLRAGLSLGDLSVATDERGEFRLDLWKVEELGESGAELVALVAGRVPARLRAAASDWRRRNAWPGDLTLFIGGEGLRIRGRVLRADGTPHPTARVEFAPPTPLLIPDAIELDEHGEPMQSSIAVEGALTPGAFVTAPVEPGRYRLRVADPDTLDEMITEPIAAGTHDVVLRLRDHGTWPVLRGVVVDRRGQPCAGADWLLERSARDGEDARQGNWQHADDEGRIEHPPLSRAIDTLCVKAAGMAEWQRVPLASLPRVDEFRVVVPVGCQVRIEADGAWRDAEYATLVTADGADSPVVITRGNLAFGTARIPLDGGRSQTFVALDDCVELRLFRGAQLVHRTPLALQPGPLIVLRP